MDLASPVAGKTALILECGPIVRLTRLFLAERGVNVVAAHLDERRMALARQFGAIATIGAGRNPFLNAKDARVLAQACPMDGPMFVIEATAVSVPDDPGARAYIEKPRVQGKTAQEPR